MSPPMHASGPVRYRCEVSGEIEPDEGRPTRARVLELSETTAFVEEVEGLEALQVGDGATLWLGLPGGAPWRAHARVTRWGSARLELRRGAVRHVTVAVRGYALDFDELADDELERLRDFLELLDGR